MIPSDTPGDDYMRRDADAFHREQRLGVNHRYDSMAWLARDSELQERKAKQEAEERKAFLESIQYDRLTPAEVDELARVDELKKQHGREPHEL